jgi:TFIIF-interacting CTD phosphatase-like protein
MDIFFVVLAKKNKKREADVLHTYIDSMLTFHGYYYVQRTFTRYLLCETLEA